MSTYEIDWKFIPPLSPWWGGFYERLVGSTKKVLFNIYGNAKLKFEELETAFAQCQWILNSRPLTMVSSSEPTLCITPNRLIFGSSHPLSSCIFSLDLSPSSPGDRLSILDSCLSTFRQRWTLEYRNIMLDNVKLRRPAPTPQIKLGDIGILWIPNKKRFNWPLAKVTEVHPGRDGNIRAITVTTSSGTYLRALNHFIPLL
jgi:hypothetical protein